MKRKKQSLGSYPLETFIGGTLQAIVESQLMLVDSITNFIKTVGYVEDKNENHESPRIIPFSYKRIAYDSQEQEFFEEDISVEVPLISIVTIPNFSINNIKYSFSVDVKEVHTQKNNFVKKGVQKVTQSSQLKVMICTPREYTRDTDKSHKIHFEIEASQAPITESLARVMDLMNQSITPKVIKRTPLQQNGNI